MFVRSRALLLPPTVALLFLCGCPLQQRPAVAPVPPSTGGGTGTNMPTTSVGNTTVVPPPQQPAQDSQGSVFQVKRLLAGTTFPDGAVPGGTYTVTRADAALQSGGVLFIPDNFTINVAPDVDQINWQFDRIEFGKGATFDLSRQKTNLKPAKAAAGSSTLKCFKSDQECDHTVNNISDGGNGGRGAAGQVGLDGTVLALRVHSLPSSGSLWVRTDGGQGGPGGDGGDGGRGDWGNCSGVFFHRGGNGGNGGDAGQGGHGGNSGVVRVEVFDPQSGQVQSAVLSSCSGNFGPATRPPSANGDTGTIVVFGNPGIGGPNGISGLGAERGHGINCGFGRSDAHDGSNGASGRPVSAALNGNCFPASPIPH